MGYLDLAIAIVAEVAGTVHLKASVEFNKLVPSIIVVVGYAIAFLPGSLIPGNYAVWGGPVSHLS
jgi:small multidrug resistance pump